MSSPKLIMIVLAGVLVAAVGSVSAQMPQDPGHRGGPGSGQRALPPQMLDRPAAQSVPAVPDTVEIRISVPDSLPQPTAVWVVQDTLEFGGLLNLVLDYGADQVDGPQLQPAAEGQWLAPYQPPELGWLARLLGQNSQPVVDLSALPETDGLRVVRSFRVYRRDPMQIRWAEQLSPVLVVRGQTVGSEETAKIRSPRSLVWAPWRLILLAVVLIALGLWFYWMWRRRQQPEPLTHWPVPAPAWLATAVDLQALLGENHVARGETALFLDRLAFLARDFVAHRYRIAAREMTGPEIVNACAALGHDPAHPAGFARLIDLADRERYNPSAPDAALCREQAVQLFGRVGRVRLQQYYASVEPARQLAAEKAWAALVDDLGLGAGRAVGSALAPEVQ